MAVLLEEYDTFGVVVVGLFCVVVVVVVVVVSESIAELVFVVVIVVLLKKLSRVFDCTSAKPVACKLIPVHGIASVHVFSSAKAALASAASSRKYLILSKKNTDHQFKIFLQIKKTADLTNKTRSIFYYYGIMGKKKTKVRLKIRLLEDKSFTFPFVVSCTISCTSVKCALKSNKPMIKQTHSVLQGGCNVTYS